MTVCILGGGNPYALNLAWCLFERGIEHFGIGRTGPKPAPFWIAPPGYKFHELSIGPDSMTILDILDEERPSVIVNFAAQGEGALSFGPHSLMFYETNVMRLADLAETLATRTYLKLFLQVGSSEVYGSTEAAAAETSPLNCSSPYAISKAAFDLHLMSMRRHSRFPATIVRPSNCYCPGQQPHRVIPQAIRAAMSGKKMRLEGGGGSVKSYLHASDLSRAIWMLIKAIPDEVYNVGPNHSVTIRSLVELVAEQFGKSLYDIAQDVPARHGEDRRYEINSVKIREEFGWLPQVSLRDGIKDMVNWFKRFPELLEMDDVYRLRP